MWFLAVYSIHFTLIWHIGQLFCLSVQNLIALPTEFKCHLTFCTVVAFWGLFGIPLYEWESIPISVKREWQTFIFVDLENILCSFVVLQFKFWMMPKVCFGNFSGFNLNWEFGTGFWYTNCIYISIICALFWSMTWVLSGFKWINLNHLFVVIIDVVVVTVAVKMCVLRLLGRLW